jgi:hypothetical protein
VSNVRLSPSKTVTIGIAKNNKAMKPPIAPSSIWKAFQETFHPRTDAQGRNIDNVPIIDATSIANRCLCTPIIKLLAFAGALELLGGTDVADLAAPPVGGV